MPRYVWNGAAVPLVEDTRYTLPVVPARRPYVVDWYDSDGALVGTTPPGQPFSPPCAGVYYPSKRHTEESHGSR